ncbi:uncharacterized protein G2W53_021879 [Senna tora]|uniref:Uncharacterized protein n=1 Tax=Senna tora TaxID=362788 RepID=A0A834TNB2_9FABA|nr:uncharacterized protein G2W53_021879 [Senna tora]
MASSSSTAPHPQAATVTTPQSGDQVDKRSRSENASPDEDTF